jgi:cyclophilin family peptidyl-prolyl cis-trans isomerase
MRITSFLLLAIVFLAFVGATPVAGQEAKPEAVAPPAGPQRQAYDTLLAQWKGLLAELEQLQAKFRTASETEKVDIRKNFAALVTKGDTMEKELIQAAEKAFIEAPNADPKLTEMLLVVASQNVARDNYIEAYRLAKMLIDNKCADKHIYDLAGVAAFATGDFDSSEKYLKMAKEQDAISSTGEARMRSLPKYKKLWAVESKLREQEAKADDLPRVLFKTNRGDIELELFENEAPIAVANFISLVDKGFYNGLTFHRVLPGFMAQGGCPEGTGTGGPGYNIPCECQQPNHRKHFIGSISMAHAGRDTGGSQFFLTFAPVDHLDGRHTVFGRVVKGLEVLPELQRRDPSKPGQPAPDKIEKATVLRKRNHEYVPKKSG